MVRKGNRYALRKLIIEKRRISKLSEKLPKSSALSARLSLSEDIRLSNAEECEKLEQRWKEALSTAESTLHKIIQDLANMQHQDLHDKLAKIEARFREALHKHLLKTLTIVSEVDRDIDWLLAQLNKPKAEGTTTVEGAVTVQLEVATTIKNGTTEDIATGAAEQDCLKIIMTQALLATNSFEREGQNAIMRSASRMANKTLVSESRAAVLELAKETEMQLPEDKKVKSLVTEAMASEIGKIRREIKALGHNNGKGEKNAGAKGDGPPGGVKRSGPKPRHQLRSRGRSRGRGHGRMTRPRGRGNAKADVSGEDGNGKRLRKDSQREAEEEEAP